MKIALTPVGRDAAGCEATGRDMMDEAFLPFSEHHRARCSPFRGEIVDERGRRALAHPRAATIETADRARRVARRVGRAAASARRRRSTTSTRRSGRRYHRMRVHGQRGASEPMATENAAWQLEDFVDSLVVELDKTRETLAVKAINKPLSYTVKEVALDLNIFPTYDGDRCASSPRSRASRARRRSRIQLGSITDQQVRATTQGARGKRRSQDRRHPRRQGHEEAAAQARRQLGRRSEAASRRRTSI